jgi:hypothetical protein
VKKPTRSLADQNSDRDEAQAKRLKAFWQANNQKSRESSPPQNIAPASTAAVVDPPKPLPVRDDPSRPIREALTPPTLSVAIGAVPLELQPWAAELASTLLDRARDKKISIRLLWPVEIDALAGLHAVASLSRVFHTDLAGLRTLYYPGTHATWTTLDRLAADRKQLEQLWQQLYETPPRQVSASFKEVLDACNEIENYNQAVPPPQLRQLIPSFIYEPVAKQWTDTKHPPLERLLTKVDRLRRREMMREKIAPEWRDPTTAPGALLILPRGIKRKEIKQALTLKVAGNELRAHVLLVDARARSAAADPQSLRRLPDFLKLVYESNSSTMGALIVTDDPTEYFVLRRRLTDANYPIDSAILAGEGEANEWLAAPIAKSVTWRPDDRSMINFTVSILDQQAALLARQFGKIAEEVRDEGPAVEDLFRNAQAFVMSISSLPGGLVDLESAETEEREYLTRDLEWTRIEGMIDQSVTEGNASTQRKQIAQAIGRVHRHLVDCQNGTPLALKLRDQVKKYAVDSRYGLTIVLSTPRNIAVAQRFLSRVLADKWGAAQSRIDWLTLSQAWIELKSRSSHRRLVLVGLNPKIVRFLVTHPEIPTGTCVLVPLQRAVGVTQTLKGLVSSETLKPYRGRLSGLLKALDDRLAEIHDIETLTRTLESLSMSTPRHGAAPSAPADPKAYRFQLEDGRIVTATGTLFRYDGIEGDEFSRVQARSIERGHCIFEMSDEIRDEIEAAIIPPGATVDTSPARKALALYHFMVKDAVDSRFPGATKQARLRAIQVKMLEIDPESSDISISKLNYWVNLKDGDSAPHGARAFDEFVLFCQVLGIAKDIAAKFWERILRVRFENQREGRNLNAIYAEILFNPESSEVYRSLSTEIVERIRAKALDCVFEVVDVQMPTVE